MMWGRSYRGFNLGHRAAVLAGRAKETALTCRASSRGDGSPPLCGEPAVWLLTCMCVHEHVVPTLACGRHAEKTRRMVRLQKVICTPCKHSSEPHTCLVTVDFAALPHDAASAA